MSQFLHSVESAELGNNLFNGTELLDHGRPIITPRDNVKPHIKGFAKVPCVNKNGGMGDGKETPYADQGRRLRWLRQAEGIKTGSAFAVYVGWAQSGYSQFETGKRRVPTDKVIQLCAKIPGFDPTWLWSGDKRGLAFDLRCRIESEEAKELASSERQDIAR